MRNPTLPAENRAALLARSGILAVVRGTNRNDGIAPELFVTILDDGTVTGYNGHVDLGTGIRTSLGQIVAEELDIPFDTVRMVLGDTEWAPNQGATTATETIQITAVPLRCAAAQAKNALLMLAAERFGMEAQDLAIEGNEVVARTGDNRRAGFGDLVSGRTLIIEVDLDTPVKPAAEYRVVGKSMRRVDIAAKAFGDLVYVHDLRLPGMLHGRVVRPPYAGRDWGEFIGKSLINVDETSIAHIPGIVKLVVIHDFIGIVAEREDQAEAAMNSLVVDWGAFAPLPEGLDEPAAAIRDNPRTTRKLVDRGNIEEVLETAAVRLKRSYVWPYHMHGSIGPCCAVADFDEAGRLTVWSGTQTQPMLRTDLALLFDLDERDVEIIRMEVAGSFGRTCADDVSADAALLSQAVGYPVRVQLTREQEHMWEPKGAGQLMEVDGGLDADGNLLAYDYQSSYPSNYSPTLPLLLTRKIPPIAPGQDAGDRTAIPPYDYPNLRINIHDMPPIARASFMRGVSAMPTSFAHESYIDELAVEAGVDAVEFRLRNMTDQRGIDLIRAVTQKAGWEPHIGARKTVVGGDIVHGRGVSYALYVHGPWPGKAAAWGAWVADVDVNRATGEVAVTRVVVGQDTGLMINPDGIRHQIHGNVIQSTSRTLKEQVTFDRQGVTSREWGSYPLIKFPEVPPIDVILMPRQTEPPLGAGESASVPSAAAIANAVYDATGVRFRELPLTPERVLAGLGISSPGASKQTAQPRRTRMAVGWKSIFAGAAALFSAGTILWPLKPAFAPIAPPGVGVFAPATIERGRVLAAAGYCAVCHTAEGGVANAGARALETPFGVVYSTNITPDPETGIGGWSYPAFERAMRQGISRDGHHLYPVFPYTAFSKMADADLEALYAYLMAQPAVRSTPPQTKLPLPFSIRPLLAGWNALFHRVEVFQSDPTRSTQWNRGAYLVDAVGHCSACHSPRNVLGAELQGDVRFGGGTAEGWDAPALATLSQAPIPWTEQELYNYLRTGASDLHGPAGGTMAPVISGLRALPDADIQAIAIFLAEPTRPSSNLNASSAADAEALVRSRENALRPVSGLGARIFDGACAVCHAGHMPDQFGARLSLALNTNIHLDRPDNLVRVILEGFADPANPARGAMPAFRNSLDDKQIAALVAFIRSTQAPGKPQWDGLDQSISRIRREADLAARHKRQELAVGLNLPSHS